MAITLTNSYQRISTIYLTYGEIRTYAKVNGQDRVNNYTGYNLKMTYYLSQWIETSRWSANLDGSTNSGNYTKFNAGETTIIETTRTINHYTDGTSPTKEISTSWSAGFGGSGSAKVEIQMPKINRIATVISANNFNDEENPTVEFNNPAGFDIAPYLNFYDNNNNIILRVVREAGLYTSPYSWELTDEERTTIRNSLNFQKSYRVNIGVYTYSGETRLGYNSVGKTLSFVNAEPTFTKTLVETDTNVINLLGSSASKIIKNASKIKTTIIPTALKGSTIKSVEIIHGTSDVVLTTSPYELVLTALTDSFKVIVTDSRGYVVSETITKELIDYSPIEISQYSFKRVNPTSSDIKLNATIKYIQQTFDTTNNTPTIQWKLGADGELNTLSSNDYSIDEENNVINIYNLLLSDILPYTQQGKLYLLVNDLLTSDAENQLVIVGIPVFDYGEYDLQVNGDLFIADRTRKNKINVLEHLIHNITTNGEPVKTGRKIDGKEEYIKRISTKLGTPTTSGTSKTWEIESGLFSFKMTMPLLAYVDVNGSIQEANIVRFTATSTGIALNPTSSHCYIDENTGTISFITAGSDRSGLPFVANIYFTYEEV